MSTSGELALIADAQRKAADLARRDVDIVGAGQIIRLGRAQEAETVLQDLEHAVAVNGDLVLGQLLENGEHHLLLAQGRCVLDVELLGVGQEVGGGLLFKFLKIHGFYAFKTGGWRNPERDAADGYRRAGAE